MRKIYFKLLFQYPKFFYLIIFNTKNIARISLQFDTIINLNV